MQSPWSPEQIAEGLKRTYPGDKDLQRSHLPQTLDQNTWGLDEEAFGALAAHRRDASLTPLRPENTHP